MSCDTCTRHNQNMNTPSLNFAQESYQGNVSIHADYPMFEQVSQDQFNALLREIGATNSRVARNEVNLIKMGKDMTIVAGICRIIFIKLHFPIHKSSTCGFNSFNQDTSIKSGIFFCSFNCFSHR